MKTFGGLVFLLSGSLAFAQQSESVPRILATEGGRFVFGQVSSLRKDQYMLDTKTGRLWQIVESKDGRAGLQAIPFILQNGKISLEARSEIDEAEPAPPVLTKNSDGVLVDEHGYSAADYLRLAAKYEREGNSEMAIFARKKAANFDTKTP